MGVVLGKPAVVLATVVGFLLIGAAAAVEVAVVSVFGHGGPEAGIILSIWAIGSIIGGLALGGMAIGPWALAARMLVVFIGIAMAGAFPRFLVDSVRTIDCWRGHCARPCGDVRHRVLERQVLRHRRSLWLDGIGAARGSSARLRCCRVRD